MNDHRDSAMQALALLDPLPATDELQARTERALQRAESLRAEGEYVPPQAGAIVRRSPRRAPLLIAAAVVSVLFVGLWAIRPGGRDAGSPDVIAMPATEPSPATSAPSMINVPTATVPLFPPSQGFREMPSIENEIRHRSPHVVIGTVTDLGPRTTHRQIMPGGAPGSGIPIEYDFMLVTVDVRETIIGPMPPGTRIDVRTYLDGPPGYRVKAGDVVLVFMSEMVPPNTPTSVGYPLSAGFLLEGESVLDPYGPTRTVDEVRNLVAATNSNATPPR